MKTVARKPKFSQVCVWPGTTGCFEDPEGFVKYFQDDFNTRVQLLQEVKTKPDQGKPRTGGRIDVLFAVHEEDIAHFAVPRLQMGIRWIEDVLDNEAHRTPSYSIYPNEIKEYRTW